MYVVTVSDLRAPDSSPRYQIHIPLIGGSSINPLEGPSSIFLKIILLDAMLLCALPNVASVDKTLALWLTIHAAFEMRHSLSFSSSHAKLVTDLYVP